MIILVATRNVSSPPQPKNRRRGLKNGRQSKEKERAQATIVRADKTLVGVYCSPGIEPDVDFGTILEVVGLLDPLPTGVGVGVGFEMFGALCNASYGDCCVNIGTARRATG